MFAKTTENDVLSNKKENKRLDHNRTLCSKPAPML